jgi:hypothetical protein
MPAIKWLIFGKLRLTAVLRQVLVLQMAKMNQLHATLEKQSL